MNQETLLVQDSSLASIETVTVEMKELKNTGNQQAKDVLISSAPNNIATIGDLKSNKFLLKKSFSALSGSASQAVDLKDKSALSPKSIASDPESLTSNFIGTVVDEKHVNFSLMYDMLTGIRISVGRSAEKADRDLIQADFSAAHKLAFDS